MGINFRELPTNTPGKISRFSFFHDKVILSDHTPYNFSRGSGDPQCVYNVETIVRRHHDYQSALVAVSEKLACQRKGANSENPFAVVVMTG